MHRALTLIAALAAIGPALADTGVAKPPPRLPTPAEQRDAGRPDSLKPEAAVVPQMQAPLGRAPAAAGGSDEVASMTLNRRLARCEVIIEPLARLECKRREEGLPPAPPRAIGASHID